MDDKFLYNHKTLRNRRRELRNNQTGAERLLWIHISKNKIGGLRFFRQYSIGSYILDFYCPKIRLVIELDGSVHKEKGVRIYDKDRSSYLENLDIKVIRFWNDDVLNNMKEITAKIQGVIENLNRVQ